jgi:hypothetical protein
MFQGMGVIGIEEDRVVELRAQAGDHGDNLADTDEVALASEVPISTGTFNARAAPVTAFNATRSDTLKWPIAIRLRWASPSASFAGGLKSPRDSLIQGNAPCRVGRYHAKRTRRKESCRKQQSKDHCHI